MFLNVIERRNVHKVVNDQSSKLKLVKQSFSHLNLVKQKI